MNGKTVGQGDSALRQEMVPCLSSLEDDNEEMV